MIRKVAEYAAAWKMLEKNDKVIAGISGGADSVCLLFVLLELQKKTGFEIVAVHVNHLLRGEEAYRDENYVKALCEKHRVLYEIYRKDVESIAKKRKQSLEEAGRDARREAFSDALQKHGGTKIALAHHKNDNAETMLMNLARGSGISGISGMHPVRGNVIRPLLCLEREEIEAYLEERGIEYCVDGTNQSDDYTRNRVRNHVIPALENGVNPKAVSHIAETMERLLEIQEYLEQETQSYYQETVKETKEGLLILAGQYEKVPRALRGALVKRAIAAMAGAEKDIQAVHVRDAAGLMEKQSGKQADLPYGLVAKRGYEGVRIERRKRREDRAEQTAVVLDLSKDGETPVGDVVISYRKKRSGVEKNYTKYFAYGIIKSNVVVRTRAPGDYITIGRDGKRQKLKSYFINEKIPEELRDTILLLAEGSHILWVIGYRRGFAYRTDPDCEETIEIKIDKGEKDNGRDNQSVGFRRRSGCEN